MSATELISTTEQEDFARLDDVVRRGLATFVEIGEALREIRDRKLYRIGFATFEAYMSHEHGLSPRHGRRLIESAGVYVEFQNGTHGSHLPANERQCRELLAYDDADRQEVWQQVVEESEKTGKPITARLINEIGKPYREPVEAQPEDKHFGSMLDATRTLAAAVQEIEDRWPVGKYEALAGQLRNLAGMVDNKLENGAYGDL